MRTILMLGMLGLLAGGCVGLHDGDIPERRGIGTRGFATLVDGEELTPQESVVFYDALGATVSAAHARQAIRRLHAAGWQWLWTGLGGAAVFGGIGELAGQASGDPNHYRLERDLGLAAIGGILVSATFGSLNVGLARFAALPEIRLAALAAQDLDRPAAAKAGAPETAEPEVRVEGLNLLVQGRLYALADLPAALRDLGCEAAAREAEEARRARLDARGGWLALPLLATGVGAAAGHQVAAAQPDKPYGFENTGLALGAAGGLALGFIANALTRHGAAERADAGAREHLERAASLLREALASRPAAAP